MKTTILTLLTLVLSINVTTAQSYPALVKVTGGTFMMGSEYSSTGRDNERPVHEVTLSDYYIGRTEVTVAQYRTYCRATGVSMPKKPDWGWSDSYPIVNVSWNDAIKYCKWLSKKLGKTITLPTEAQWEFAARGGSKSKGYEYSGSNNMDEAGRYDKNSDETAHRVATRKANELGLYDMSGNVYEWCLDWYDEGYYINSPNKNPQGPSTGRSKVLRGGSWIIDASICRVADRYDFNPGFRFDYGGFRVVSL